MLFSCHVRLIHDLWLKNSLAQYNRHRGLYTD
jgi:hypothetical protein